jgi:periplasmic protein TonB
MKKLLLITVVLVSGLLLSVKSDGQDKKKTGDVYNQAEVMPVFPGGEEALRTYLASNVNYPDDAKKEGVQGKVFVNFIIDEAGKVGNVKVLKGVSPSIDKEAVRVVAGMPDWTPGKEKGKNVKVQFTIPIQFALK